jgi:hypothetical protein
MQLELGTRPGVIARYLNRSRSTITRELHRNGWQRRGVFRGRVRKCQRELSVGVSRRACRPIGLSSMRVKRKLVPGSELWDQVVAYLHQGLSPDLESNRLIVVSWRRLNQGQNDSLAGLKVIVIFNARIELDNCVQQRRCAAVESCNADAGK